MHASPTGSASAATEQANLAMESHVNGVCASDQQVRRCRRRGPVLPTLEAFEKGGVS
ncbi:hypothetical protein BS17DRAFT_773675 [Gyrodon lividus]|nr:hypothetical protein BS17DRAFT_773675 [Gyrodon lividus]